uniref:Uncharacterized protein n=1 Tax=Davidia involucrata TaxID=16924 RepID=A0A5B7BC94_DAVIN
MEETAEAYNYICNPFCFFRLSLLCFVLLVASTCFISFGLSTFLISLSVVMVSIFFLFLFTKKKRTLDENLINDHENLLQQNELDQIHHYQVGSPDFQPNSGSEDGTVTSEDFELNWTCPNNGDWGLISSSDDDGDGDDTDDDNLIEISLPKQSIRNFKEELMQKPQQSQSDLLPEYIFQQEGLMELVAEINEMNEEENLIEIDISNGIHQVFKVCD